MIFDWYLSLSLSLYCYSSYSLLLALTVKLWQLLWYEWLPADTYSVHSRHLCRSWQTSLQKQQADCIKKDWKKTDLEMTRIHAAQLIAWLSLG